MAKAAPLTANRALALANYCDEVIFCVGGKSMQQGQEYNGATSMYNIKGDEWTQGPTMAVPRENHSCCTLDHMLYAIAGRNAQGRLNSIEKIDA